MLTSKSFWPDAMISSLGAVQVMGSRMPISQERCQPTDFETDPLEPAQIAELVTYVSGWETVDCSTGPRLTKSFPFEDWLTAIAFVTLIAEQATFEDEVAVFRSDRELVDEAVLAALSEFLDVIFDAEA